MSSSLERRVAELEAEVAWMRQIFEAQGISTWMPTSQAASVLKVSVRYLLEEIRRSRLNLKDSDFKSGIHYRHIGKGGAARPSWQINVPEVQKIWASPVEKRRSA